MPVGSTGRTGSDPVLPLRPAAVVDEQRPPPRAATEESDPNAFERLREAALACRRCRLCETRSTVVFGEGSRRPRLLVIGEAPGADEDASGRPFVGKAGQLLTKMLAAIGLAREDVFIANVLKCRPPGNRPPAPDEVAACRPYLDEQIRLLDPELLLLLGNHATRAVLGTDRGITSLRGRITTTPAGRPALPTYHPSFLLRTPEAKRDSWLDLQLVAKTLGLAIPERAGRAPDGENP
jgi:DNA polymerase